jgi:hypothetical protein
MIGNRLGNTLHAFRHHKASEKSYGSGPAIRQLSDYSVLSPEPTSFLLIH